VPDRPPWNAILRALREARGLSQEVWAARLGCSRRTVVRWERDEAVPDAAAEAAIVALCAEQGVFRGYDAGPLAGLALSPAWLHELLTAARLHAHLRRRPPGGAHLPAVLSSFIGRERETEEAGALLGAARLLTLTGVGGTGKTRLALAVAEAAAPAYPDGAWFVDLSDVRDLEGIVPAIAHALGVAGGGGRSLVAALGAYLRGRRLLLLLDNAEHLIDAAPLLHALLAGSPGLRLLVTSRVRLRLAEEQELPLAPLPVPEATEAEPARLAQNPAVRLFTARARALQPDFALTAENAAAVAAICRRLDGLPLAIELAASRVKLLPPAALLARLDHGLELLGGGAPSLPARQQTLRAAIAWSWNLLAPPEQALFRRLSVFSGGWTLAAAEAVAGADGALDVLAGLAALLDQSLLRRDEAAGEPRFSMLATLREFALEQLAASGETAALRRRHAHYCCALSERCWARWRQNGRVLESVLLPIDAERENIIAALRWALETEPGVGLRIAGCLSTWFYLRAPGEGRRWAEALLADRRAAESDPARALALYSAGICCLGQAQGEAAVAYFEQAAARFRAAEDWPMLARVHALLSANVPAGAATRARSHAEEALALARATGEAHEIAFAESFAGSSLLRHGGDSRQVRAHLQEALRLTRQLGADLIGLSALSVLAGLELREGRSAIARRLYRESVPLAEALGGTSDLAQTHMVLARLAENAGEEAEALGEWRRALVLARDVESATLGAACLIGIAGRLTVAGRAQTAARLLAAAPAGWRDEPLWVSALPQETYLPALAATRAALGEAAFDEAWAAGRALALEQAIALALAEAEDEGREIP